MRLQALAWVAAIGLPLALFAADAVAGPAKTERERNDLIGPVETVLFEFQHAPPEGEEAEYYTRDRTGFETYDRQGLLIGQTVFNPDFVDELEIKRLDVQTVVTRGSIVAEQTTHVTLDERGNVAEMATYFGSGVGGELSQKRRYLYDAGGTVIEEDWYDRDGTQFAAIRFTRGGDGNVTQEETSYNGAPPPYQVTTYSYEFDSHGNWIKRIERSNDPANGQLDLKPFGTRFRTITYYSE